MKLFLFLKCFLVDFAPLGTSRKYITSSAMLKSLGRPDTAGKALDVVAAAPKSSKKYGQKFLKKKEYLKHVKAQMAAKKK